MEAGIASNPKLFWQFINNKRGTSRVPGTMMWNNTSLEKPDDIVAAFRSTFASVYDISNSTPPVDVDLEVINNSFNFVQFTAEEDLLNKLNCDVLAYADDIKIFCRINSPSDCQHLQNNLSVINTWCMENRVNLNINKCGVVTFARVSNPHSFIYNIDQIPIPRKSEIKDLGILFDTKLSFTNHIASISKSASKMLGFIIRSCRQFTSPLALISLFYSLVRSKLEYASVIWYPCYLYQQLMLERVQRRFLKYLSFKFDGTYPPRGVDYEYLLRRHNFSSLSQRRDEASGKFLMNLILSRSDNPCLLSQVYFLVPIYGTRSSDTVLVPRARTNSLYGSPLGHMTRNFNLLFPDPF